MSLGLTRNEPAHDYCALIVTFPNEHWVIDGACGVQPVLQARNDGPGCSTGVGSATARDGLIETCLAVCDPVVPWLIAMFQGLSWRHPARWRRP